MEIYNYVFHYNPHTELWYAIPRDTYLLYWNNKDADGVLKSKSIDTLIDIISKGKEFIDSVSQ